MYKNKLSNFLIFTIFLSLLSSCMRINHPPNTPDIPFGPSIADINESSDFTVNAPFDPDDDVISIRFDWGDGDTSSWSNYVPVGDTIIMSHSWEDSGAYYVRIQAKDVHGAISAWSQSHKIEIGTGEGTLKWKFTTEWYVVTSPAISADGTVYVGSYDGNLYAIYGSGSLANTPWPMFHHDLRHTGRQ